jgi:hypothetical protein
MTDTAQPLAAETDPVALAAAAFRAQREPAPAPARDDAGRFAAAEAQEADEIEADQSEAVEADDEAAEYDAETDTGDEAADEAQPDPVAMPASWSKEDAELWTALPPETQGKIAEREGQREAAVNAKFQETANARKAAEAQLAEANTNRDSYREAIDTVLSMVKPAKPDPRNFGLGTSDYQRDAYDYAVLQYEQQTEIVQSLTQQQQAIAAQQREEAEKAERQAYEDIETRARPALIAAVPDITDPQKQAAAIGEIVAYAVSQGIPEHVFSDPENAKRITSAELLMAWKASQFDKQQEAKGRVVPKAQPKPATPPLRPGVTTPRAAVQQARVRKDMERLERTGSIEDGAAIFRHLRKG